MTQEPNFFILKRLVQKQDKQRFGTVYVGTTATYMDRAPIKMTVTSTSQIFVKNLLTDFVNHNPSYAVPIWDCGKESKAVLKTFRFIVGRYSRAATSRWTGEINAGTDISPTKGKRARILSSSCPTPQKKGRQGPKRSRSELRSKGITKFFLSACCTNCAARVL